MFTGIQLWSFHGRQTMQDGRPFLSAGMVAKVVFGFLAAASLAPAPAQVFRLTRDQLIHYTAKNPASGGRTLRPLPPSGYST
jgi:hypothetical protein